MAEKLKNISASNVKPQDKGLTEQDVIRLIDAYINSPSFRLKTGSLQSNEDGWVLSADGTFQTSKQIISTLATGTAPFSITSTTLVSNLNVDQVDGYDLNQDVTTAGSPTFAALTISGDTLNIATQDTPASAGATGTKGDIVHDTDYIYVCTATNTWKRAAISTW